MPESERSEEGISSWDEPSELLIVTRFVTGTLSFSHLISGCGEACKKIKYFRPGYNTLWVSFMLSFVAKHSLPQHVTNKKLKHISHLKVHCDPDRVPCPHHHKTLHLVVCELWPH